MKIVLISRRYPPLIGGAEKVFSYLARGLAAEGAEVTVLTARPTGPGEEAPETESLVVGAGRLTVVRLATSRWRFLGTWLYMRRLFRWFMTYTVDIAYVSMLKHDAYATVPLGDLHGFPVVLRPEGAGATGDVAWHKWGRFGKRIAEECKNADAFVSISPAITDELTGAGFDPSKIHALPNGVPIPEPPWNRRADWRARPRATFVGRLAPEKGLELLIDAWPDVQRAFPNARLSLIGEGPERPALEARIATLGLTEAIEMPGASDDPTHLLRGSDLFVLPSREEGMSIALLEAMALGVPLVATAIPGNRRLVQNFKHGRLVPPENAAALAAAIIDQWSSFDRAFQMSREARKRAQAEFSIQAVARRHMELFQRLIDEKKDRAV